MGLSSHLPISAHVAPCWCTRNFFFFSLMHPIGPELPISAHVACAHVCRQLYVLCASHARVQATVGVGTVIIVYIGVAYTRGGGGTELGLGTWAWMCMGWEGSGMSMGSFSLTPRAQTTPMSKQRQVLFLQLLDPLPLARRTPCQNNSRCCFRIFCNCICLHAGGGGGYSYSRTLCGWSSRELMSDEGHVKAGGTGAQWRVHA